MIGLRTATLADAPLLQHWDEQPHVLASDPNDDWQWQQELGRDTDWREQLIAEHDGRAIGFIQIIHATEEDSHYWGEIAAGVYAIDIWIGEAPDLGKGYGTQMMQLALGRCFARPDVHTVVIDPLVSNVRAHRFYERLGFQFVAERQFGVDRCRVYELRRSDFRQRYGGV